MNEMEANVIERHISIVAQELSIAPVQVSATAELLADDATVPFISRYRKEKTGGLDEVAITAIRDRLAQLVELDARRETILKSIHAQGKLTPKLQAAIEKAPTLAALEDLYLPYKPKRRTRATIAVEKGLEPLAAAMLEQREDWDPAQEAQAFVDAEKGVETVEDALAGTRDIVAEWVNEDQQARACIRVHFTQQGQYQCRAIKGKEEVGFKYENYFDWQEPLAKSPSHRILAMRRGEKEGFLRLRIVVPQEKALSLLEALFVKRPSPAAEQVKLAVADGYKRLLVPSIETEIRLESKKQADRDAIKVFSRNLRQLLLASPLGQKAILAIDPGFRTGCKVVCLDRQGQLLHDTVIYPSQGVGNAENAARILRDLVERFGIETIAIGNGTAGRETESFVKKLDLDSGISVIMVNESGASVYSASEVARGEFPDKDLTVRGAVSIGRRLADPLAELVKIDPKSIGVGQYQHDVDQGLLKQGLDDVVVSCVNSVGVELNTASKQLLTYVSGLGPQLAQNIVDYRNEHGPFQLLTEIEKVPRLGVKAFEQAGGFLRIRDAAQPLDNSAVHPERYALVDTMARDADCTVRELIADGARRETIKLDRYVTEEVGLPTLNDIMTELAKPGRDPRPPFEQFAFTEGVESIQDVKAGMVLPGIVTNVTAFGAFIDIGVHQEGLVHISELSDRFVKDPADEVKVHQKVRVTVKEVDLRKRRIALSMKQGKAAPAKTRAKEGTQTREKPLEKSRDRPVTKPKRPSPSKPKSDPPTRSGRDRHEPLGDRLQIRLK
ncbi:MAG: RNA-binding transcriptional accessory protein [Planctomycetes bacterium]|nr:RNA-binding transcriptional accessory protein [Planctomycetota bacterium]